MSVSSCDREKQNQNSMQYFEIESKKIYDTFNTNEEQVRKDVVHLMEWLEQQPHLPKIKDETLLIHMLLMCENTVEKCKNKINSYYIFRANFPELISGDICSSELKTAFLMLTFIPMPKLSVSGDRYYVWRLSEPYDYEAFPIHADLYNKTLILTQDITLKTVAFKKDFKIIDVKNVSLPLIKIIFDDWTKLSIYYDDFVFINLSIVYVINCPPAIEPYIKAIKFLLPKKASENFHIFSDKNSDVTEILPECKSIMSSTYGGLERPIEELRALYYDYISHNLRDWLIAGEEAKADLSKVPADMQTANYSLKQLQFD